MSEILLTPIHDLGLPHKALEGLLEAGVEDMDALLRLSRAELDQIPGVGNVTLRKIDTWCKINHLALHAPGDDIPDGEEIFVSEEDSEVHEAEVVHDEEHVEEVVEEEADPEDAEVIEDAQEVESEVHVPEHFDGLSLKALHYLSLKIQAHESRLPYMEGFSEIGAVHVLDLVCCSLSDLKKAFTAKQILGLRARLALSELTLGMDLSLNTVDTVIQLMKP